MLVEVILPQYLPYDLTYSVSDAISHLVCLGVRVEIPTGKSGISTAVISKILSHDEEIIFTSKMRDKKSTVKGIISIIDTKPIITETQMKLWLWIAEYYMCSVGEVMAYFLPKELIVKGQVDIFGKSYKKNSSVVKRRVLEVADEADFSSSRSSLAKYILEKGVKTLLYSDLRDLGFSAAQIKTLVNNGLLTEREERIIKELKTASSVTPSEIIDIKNPEFQDDIDGLSDKPLLIISPTDNFCLAENYIFMINRELSKGKSVLFINPESSNMVSSFAAIFGNRVVNFNAKMTLTNRVKSYSRLLGEESLLVIGDKKSLGLPFKNLSLVIIADEHSRGYRSENSPRFMGRDVALMLSHYMGADVIINSFAPTLESYYNTLIGKYNLLEVGTNQKIRTKLSVIDKYSIAPKERKQYGNVPAVRYFSKLLLEKMAQSDSSFLFHNRRGYNNFLICGDCGWVLRCPHCNVSMTYHHGKKEFVCHYCNHKITPVMECEECGSKNIKLKGIGSENIEMAIKKYFPLNEIVRVDSDTFNDFRANKGIVQQVNDGNPKIVIGTQLAINILKENRFGVVGVIDADTIFNAGEFRAEESAYRILTELSTIASGGDLVVQCSDINRPILKDIATGDYLSMATRELSLRETFAYPPFVRLVRITLRDKDEDKAYSTAESIAKELREKGVADVSEPIAPFVDKIKDEYLFQIILKLNRRGDNSNLKRIIKSVVEGSTKNRIIEVDI